MNDISPEQAEAILKQMDADVGILVLVQGTLPDGSQHYAYASIPPSRYMAFKQAEAAGNYDLAQFGKILTHGKGEPSPDVKRRMEEEHGANHRFEEDMEIWAREVQQVMQGNKNS
jgi:hypothetical protein